jgi:hypothetical protein
MLGRTRIALLAAVFAIAISGCGGSDGGDGSIPMENSDTLLNLLAHLKEQISNNECTLAVDTAKDVTAAVGNLPSNVDPDVHEALTKSSEHLVALAEDPNSCNEGTTGEGGVLPTDTSTPTETTSTDTSTTSTTDEPSAPTDTGETPPTGQNQTPPAGDNGDGQTGDQGAGNGGAPTGGVEPGGKR